MSRSIHPDSRAFSLLPEQTKLDHFTTFLSRHSTTESLLPEAFQHMLTTIYTEMNLEYEDLLKTTNWAIIETSVVEEEMRREDREEVNRLSVISMASMASTVSTDDRNLIGKFLRKLDYPGWDDRLSFVGLGEEDGGTRKQKHKLSVRQSRMGIPRTIKPDWGELVASVKDVDDEGRLSLDASYEVIDEDDEVLGNNGSLGLFGNAELLDLDNGGAPNVMSFGSTEDSQVGRGRTPIKIADIPEGEEDNSTAIQKYGKGVYGNSEDELDQQEDSLETIRAPSSPSRLGALPPIVEEEVENVAINKHAAFTWLLAKGVYTTPSRAKEHSRRSRCLATLQSRRISLRPRSLPTYLPSRLARLSPIPEESGSENGSPSLSAADCQPDEATLQLHRPLTASSIYSIQQDELSIRALSKQQETSAARAIDQRTLAPRKHLRNWLQPVIPASAYSRSLHSEQGRFRSKSFSDARTTPGTYGLFVNENPSRTTTEEVRNEEEHLASTFTTSIQGRQRAATFPTTNSSSPAVSRACISAAPAPQHEDATSNPLNSADSPPPPLPPQIQPAPNTPQNTPHIQIQIRPPSPPPSSFASASTALQALPNRLIPHSRPASIATFSSANTTNTDDLYIEAGWGRDFIAAWEAQNGRRFTEEEARRIRDGDGRGAVVRTRREGRDGWWI